MDCQHTVTSLNVTPENGTNTSGSMTWADNKPTNACPHCGRGGHYTSPYYPPYQPNYPYMPIWQWFPDHSPTYTTGTATMPPEPVKVWC